MLSTTAASAALAVGTTSPLQPFLLRGGDGHRQAPARRPRGAVEGQFADDGIFAKFFRHQLSAAGQHPQRDRQIERGGLLRQLGRGQIDDHPILRPLETPS